MAWQTIPNTVTVLVDDREKYPILFPKYLTIQDQRTGRPRLLRVLVRTTRLPCGDYCLRWAKAKCVIERKASVEELAQNLCSGDWFRQMAAFKRLRKFSAVRYLLIDGSLGDLTRYCKTDTFKAQYQCPDPNIVISRLVHCCIEFGMNLWWIGGGRQAAHRTTLGAVLLNLMIQHAFGTVDEDRRLLDEMANAVQAREKNAKKAGFSVPRRRTRGTLKRTNKPTADPATGTDS